MAHQIDHFRRRFLGSAAVTLAAGPLRLFDVAHAQSGTRTDDVVPGTHTLTGGIGHNLPQEAPQAFATAVVDADAL